MKLLSICIATYKRSETLRRCIESVSKQIEKYKLMDDVNIYVANDASPDNTTDVLLDYKSLLYFKAVSRETNLGMNVNIKTMLAEVKDISEFQLIITDDDYLQSDTLNGIVEFLKEKNNDIENLSAIWTPRYSYTDDGKLHTIVCNPFNKNMFIRPSVAHVGKYMSNGFVLSGLIIRAKSINYEFWEKYKDNAYFPILFFGDLLLQNGAYYWNKNIVHHTVLNECHWERWGKNDAIIEFRLFSDFVNAYSIMAKRFRGKIALIQFYIFLFPSLRRVLVGRLMSGELNRSSVDIFEAVDDLKIKGFMHFEFQIKILMACALILSANISILKIIITRVNLLFVRKNDKKKHYFKRIKLNVDMLNALPVLAKSVLL